MFGLDDWIAHFSDGATLLLVVVGVADPARPPPRDRPGPSRRRDDADRLRPGADEAARPRGSASPGASGHATSLFAFGLPIVLFKAYLPERGPAGSRDRRRSRDRRARRLAARPLAARPRPRPRARARGGRHLHVHDHAEGSAHRHTVRARSPLQAFGIGLVHGMGGSAGVGVLLLAAIHNRGVAVAGARAVRPLHGRLDGAPLDGLRADALASATAQRRSTGSHPRSAAPSLLFGVWYALGALQLAPYFF